MKKTHYCLTDDEILALERIPQAVAAGVRAFCRDVWSSLDLAKLSGDANRYER